MAPQFSFGPVYCETLTAVPGHFPAEPLNTISNGIIVLFGIAAALIVARRASRQYDLYVLAALLTATGIGSGLWHGLREPWALAWDVTPGLIFLFALVFCWARRLWGYGGAVAFAALFYFGFRYSREFWGVVQRWVALAPLVVLAGAVLIGQTAFRSRKAAVMGSAALASGLAALFFRTIDLEACAYVPFGTHFLWHALLSAGGFTGILTLLKLPAARPLLSAQQPAE